MSICDKLPDIQGKLCIQSLNKTKAIRVQALRCCVHHYELSNFPPQWHKQPLAACSTKPEHVLLLIRIRAHRQLPAYRS